MKNQQLAGSALVQTWIRVRDERGRERLEARWTTTDLRALRSVAA